MGGPRGDGDDEPEAVLDGRRFGLGEDELDGIRRSLSASGCGDEGVWPENAPIVAAFLAAASQWRTTLAPTRNGLRMFWIGLDYAGARAGIEAAGITITPDLWEGVRVMEEAARDTLNGVGG